MRGAGSQTRRANCRVLAAEELLAKFGIDAAAIVKQVKALVSA